MKQYRIYEQPTGIREVIKVGWSWPGFFFTRIWALVKKLWGIGFGVMAVIIVRLIVQIILSEVIFGNRTRVDQNAMIFLDLLVLAQNIGVPVLFGVKGNDWRESNLLGRRFELKGTVMASNVESAISTYLENHEYSINRQE